MNERRCRRALLACAVLSLWPAAAPASAARSAEASFADAVVAQVNVERDKAGVRPLRRSAPLSNVAAWHAVDLTRLGRLSHASSDGTPMAQRIRRGVRARHVAETLAWLPPDRAGAALAVSSWMQSPSHRASLLSPRFARIGVAKRPAMAGVVVAADLASAR